MIVYGDCPIQIKCNEFIRRFQRRVTDLPTDLQELRVRLVLAGQLQQATEDAGLSCAQRCSALTSTAADALVPFALGGPPARRPEQAMLRQLDAIAQFAPAHGTLTIRTPEGFAWYALFPDAYAQAADEWVRGVASDAAVMVVGIRSIGTTLAATVAAVLKAHCRQVTCVTVRPHGHPFDRKATLPPPRASADYAIIVDEGPGLSGSSMVAVADAIVALGMPRAAITFFPGHGHGPGCEARPHVRRCWRETPAQYVAWERLRFATRSAPQVLVEAAESLLVQ